MKSSRANSPKKLATKKPLKRFENGPAGANTSLKRVVNERPTNGSGNGRREILKRLGIEETNAGVFSGEWSGSGKLLESVSPIDGEVIARVRTATPKEYEQT